ncbi:MAG: TetR/AcrR family transcriptional regulator [Mycobacterium sp.]
MANGQAQRRSWAGVSPAERADARRRELMAAGVRLLGLSPRPAVTVRAVCRSAGMTERYFYENFTDRDTFVRAVYDHVGFRAIEALSGARTPHEGVDAFVRLMVDEPTMGRVLLIAPTFESTLQESGFDWLPRFVALLQGKLSTNLTDEVQQQLVATSLVGALTSLFSAYLNEDLNVDRQRFVDYCVQILVQGATATPSTVTSTRPSASHQRPS